MHLRPTGFFSALLISVFALFNVPQAAAQGIETIAKEAILLDFETGEILYEKKGDERMYPASMTKMMTVYILMKRLKEGTLSLDDEFPVSEKAWRKGGSKMFVEVGKRVTVDELLHGIIVQSGNDATIVVAEGLSGTEESFAREMNATALEIGMTGSNFMNASGWPHPDHYTTSSDLAQLAVATIRDFPQMYKLYNEREYTFNGISQANRNPLLRRDIGADGLKTGHTEASGYGLTGSAVKDGRRLIVVVNGLESTRDRGIEAEKLLNWGFREWNSYKLLKAGDIVEEAPVWLGTSQTVPLVLQDDVAITLRRTARDDLRVTVTYDGPIPAPIQSGQQVGMIQIEAPGIEARNYPLLAGAAVERLGPVGRVSALANHLIWGLAP